MTELEKCIELKNRGYIYDWIFGVVRNKEGKEVGCFRAGYKGISFSYNKKGQILKAHRFGWYMFYGKLPQNEIDHINGDRKDNRITNLRDVTHQQNNFNKKAKGYYFHKHAKKFSADIRKDGKNIHLGYFDTEQQAHAAYLEAKKIYHKI